MAEPPAIDLTFTYPKSWYKPPEPERHHEPERAMMAWLDDLGLFPTAEIRLSIEKLYGGYCVATSFVDAVHPRLNTLAKFCGLWTLYEDSTEGAVIGSEFMATVALALAGELQRERYATGPMRGWREVGQEFSRTMTRAWCHRFGRRFESWQQSVVDETQLFSRCGQHPEATEYYIVRHRTVGVHTWMDLTEYALNRELPVECFADLDFMEIARITVDVPLIQNELFSLTKDRENLWPNAAYTVVAGQRGAEGEVLQQLVRIHDTLIDRFLVLEQRLRSGALSIDWWLEGAHHIIAGLALWCMASPRFAREHRLSDGTTVRLSLDWSEQADETP